MTLCQFNQHFPRTFFLYESVFFFCQNITNEKLREALSFEKHACKMLIKLTTGYFAILNHLEQNNNVN